MHVLEKDPAKKYKIRPTLFSAFLKKRYVENIHPIRHFKNVIVNVHVYVELSRYEIQQIFDFHFTTMANA